MGNERDGTGGGEGREGRKGYVEAVAAKNAFDLKLKRALLEEGGIPTFVASDFANEIFGLSHSPFVARKGPDPFTVMVPEEKLEEARALLSAADVPEAEASIVLMDWQHGMFLADGGWMEREGVDLSEFAFLGESRSESGAWAFFLAGRGWGSSAVPPTASFEPAAALFRRVPGLQAAYCDAVLGGYDPGKPLYEVFGFCGVPRWATKLGKLVLSGRKTGTSSLLWEFEEEGERAPEAGGLSIVVDGRGRPLCAIETTGVEILPFKDVGPEHARAEGEGDRSLRYWRKVHADFFGRDREGKRPFDEDAPVVCERFFIAYRFV